MLQAHFTTSDGNFTISLFEDGAPNTVANFVGLAEGTLEWTDPRTGQKVKRPYYDGLVFHRVIATFMIQGGGFDADMKERPTRAPIPLESRNGLSNKRGTVAMARTSVPDSASSQFFINVGDNAFLDAANARDGNGYAVFGTVVSGMDVVDRIREVAVTNKAGHQNVPQQPVVIRKATLESSK